MKTIGRLSIKMGVWRLYKLSKNLERKAGQLYLSCVCAEDFPEQCPEHKHAKWYDLLWLLVPIVGFLGFTEGIKIRAQHNG